MGQARGLEADLTGHLRPCIRRAACSEPLGEVADHALHHQVGAGLDHPRRGRPAAAGRLVLHRRADLRGRRRHGQAAHDSHARAPAGGARSGRAAVLGHPGTPGGRENRRAGGPPQERDGIPGRAVAGRLARRRPAVVYRHPGRHHRPEAGRGAAHGACQRAGPVQRRAPGSARSSRAGTGRARRTARETSRRRRRRSRARGRCPRRA